MDFYNLDVKASDQINHRKIYDRLKEEEEEEVLSTTKFDENSDLRTTYLGRIDMTRLDQNKSRRNISYIRERVYSRKAIRWHGMSDTFRYGSK